MYDSVSLRFSVFKRNGNAKMTDALEALIAKAQKIQMTESQAREQRLSFVYGNTHIENARITREMVAEADAKVAGDERRTQDGTQKHASSP